MGSQGVGQSAQQRNADGKFDDTCARSVTLLIAQVQLPDRLWNSSSSAASVDLEWKMRT